MSHWQAHENPQRIVVVGAGLAGVRTCQELRSQGYHGELVLLGAETHLPYDRPPLSKEFLLADSLDDVVLDVDPDWYANVDLRLGVTATAVHPGSLETSAGSLDWDALVLAVGATPARLTASGSSLFLRTRQDAVQIRAALRPAIRVIVIGAGWIGAEIATAAAYRGARVTVLEAADAPLATAVGSTVGSFTTCWYAEAGVALQTNALVSTVDDSGVRLATGEQLAADVVIQGIGVQRELDWLAGSQIAVDNGILVDTAGRTNVPGIYAVGDCAARWSLRANRRIRTEHWDDALRAPQAVAAAVLGKAAEYDPVSYVWSEQFGRYLQWLGWRNGDPDVWRGDPTSGDAWAAAWLDTQGRITGFFAVDRQRDIGQARRLIAADHIPDLQRFADPTVPLRNT